MISNEIEQVTQRRLDIQGLRAVAVLLVVLCHSGLQCFTGGFIGVDVFFVISGFVIFGMFHSKNFLGKDGLKFRNFYVQRFWRLTPALSLMISSVLIASIIFLSPFGQQQNAAMTAIGAMFLSANIVITKTSGDYFSLDASTNPFLNTWSLSVEEQIYIALPVAFLLVAWIARKLNLRWRIFTLRFAVATAAFSISFFLLVFANYAKADGQSLIFSYYSPTLRIWEFAAGALAFWVTIRIKYFGIFRYSGLFGFGLILWGAVAFNAETPWPSFWTLVPVAGTVLILLSGSRSNSFSRLLAHKSLVATGDASYSIYLWHWPVIVIMTSIFIGFSHVGVLAAALSFIPAFLAYKYFETPLRKATRWKIRGRSIHPVVLIIVPVAIASLVFAGAHNKWWLEWPSAY